MRHLGEKKNKDGRCIYNRQLRKESFEKHFPAHCSPFTQIKHERVNSTFTRRRKKGLWQINWKLFVWHFQDPKRDIYLIYEILFVRGRNWENGLFCAIETFNNSLFVHKMNWKPWDTKRKITANGKRNWMRGGDMDREMQAIFGASERKKDRDWAREKRKRVQ